MTEKRFVRRLLARLLVVGAIGGGSYFAVPRAPGWVRRWQAHREASQRQLVRDDLVRLRAVVDRFAGDTARFPETWPELWSRPAKTPGWKGPYLGRDEQPPVDPWGNPYSYRLLPHSGNPELLSLGADGEPGGKGLDADVTDLAARFTR